MHWFLGRRKGYTRNVSTDTIHDVDPVNLTIRIDKKLLADIERIAEAERRTKSSMVRVFLEDSVAAWDDEHQEKKDNA